MERFEYCVWQNYVHCPAKTSAFVSTQPSCGGAIATGPQGSMAMGMGAPMGGFGTM